MAIYFIAYLAKFQLSSKKVKLNVEFNSNVMMFTIALRFYHSLNLLPKMSSATIIPNAFVAMWIAMHWMLDIYTAITWNQYWCWIQSRALHWLTRDIFIFIVCVHGSLALVEFNGNIRECSLLTSLKFRTFNRTQSIVCLFSGT